MNKSKSFDPHAECEDVVWILCTNPSPLRILRAIDILCPSCSQKLRDFLAIEQETSKKGHFLGSAAGPPADEKQLDFNLPENKQI